MRDFFNKFGDNIFTVNVTTFCAFVITIGAFICYFNSYSF